MPRNLTMKLLPMHFGTSENGVALTQGPMESLSILLLEPMIRHVIIDAI
jgi:hypothetical protein